MDALHSFYSFRVFRAVFFMMLLVVMATIPLDTLGKGDKGKDLKKALKSGDKTIEFSGKEGDDITIPKNVSVIGISPDRAVINGDVSMENGSTLKNVTINAQVFGVTVEKGASVTLENVTIKGASDSGVFSKEGGGTLSISHSRITGNRKGMYILPGKTLILSGNEISRNKEEGVDARSRIGGNISGNTITNNGEGGIEVVVGGSGLSLQRNTFSSNKSSGLSLQFYSDSNDLGRVRIISNNFSGNGDFAVTCGTPSGGDTPQQFFRNSVVMQGNILKGNNDGSISSRCHFGNSALPAPATEKQAEEKQGEISDGNFITSKMFSVSKNVPSLLDVNEAGEMQLSQRTIEKSGDSLEESLPSSRYAFMEDTQYFEQLVLERKELPVADKSSVCQEIP